MGRPAGGVKPTSFMSKAATTNIVSPEGSAELPRVLIPQMNDAASVLPRSSVR